MEMQQRYAYPKKRVLLIGKDLKQTNITKDFTSYQWTIRIWKFDEIQALFKLNEIEIHWIPYVKMFII